MASFWWWRYGESSAFGVFQWEECEVDGDGVVFLTLLGVSFTIVNMLLHLFFFFIGLKLDFTSKFTMYVDYIHARYYLFFLFATPETILLQLCICISLTDHSWVVSICVMSRVKPGPHLLPSHAYTPLHLYTCASASQDLCCHIRPIINSFNYDVLCCSHEHLMVHRRATYGCPYKTVVVPFSANQSKVNQPQPPGQKENNK